MTSAIDMPEKPKWHRNLFSKTLVGQKRERQTNGHQVPFNFSIEVSQVPPPTVPPTAFVPLPDTFLLLNVPEDIAGAVLTSCTLNVPFVGDSQDTKLPSLSVNLNIYVLDVNRRAQQKPISVASLSSSGALATKINVPLNAKTSVMISPGTDDRMLLEQLTKGGSSCPSVSLMGYIIDEEGADREADDEKVEKTLQMSTTVRRFLAKMARQSSLKREQ